MCWNIWCKKYYSNSYTFIFKVNPIKDNRYKRELFRNFNPRGVKRVFDKETKGNCSIKLIRFKVLFMTWIVH